jgi:Fe-S-cluster containining protein
VECEGCKAHCCKKFIKFISIHDADRIMKSLKLDPTHFLDLRPAEGIKNDFPEVLINDKPFFLALDSKMAKEDCTFLLEVGSTRRCGIHAIRPMGCKTYPFELKETGLETVESVLCPWQYWPKGEEREKYIRDISQSRLEREEYKKIVEKWNSRHSEKGDFISFINFALDTMGNKE